MKLPTKTFLTIAITGATAGALVAQAQQAAPNFTVETEINEVRAFGFATCEMKVTDASGAVKTRPMASYPGCLADKPMQDGGLTFQPQNVKAGASLETAVSANQAESQASACASQSADFVKQVLSEMSANPDNASFMGRVHINKIKVMVTDNSGRSGNSVPGVAADVIQKLRKEDDSKRKLGRLQYFEASSSLLFEVGLDSQGKCQPELAKIRDAFSGWKSRADVAAKVPTEISAGGIQLTGLLKEESSKQKWATDQKLKGAYPTLWAPTDSSSSGPVELAL